MHPPFLYFSLFMITKSLEHLAFLQCYSSVLWLSLHLVSQFTEECHPQAMRYNMFMMTLPALGLIWGQISFLLHLDHG